MTLHDIPVTTIDGRATTMGEFKGRTLLVVNVASQCGFTPQYAGLEQLWRNYRDRGLTIVGFPCDQFGHQEPGTDAEIAQFCVRTYDVTFPILVGPEGAVEKRYAPTDTPEEIGKELAKRLRG